LCGTAIALSEIAAEIVYQDVAALSRAFKLLMMWLMVAHPLIFGVACAASGYRVACPERAFELPILRYCATIRFRAACWLNSTLE